MNSIQVHAFVNAIACDNKFLWNLFNTQLQLSTGWAEITSSGSIDVRKVKEALNTAICFVDSLAELAMRREEEDEKEDGLTTKEKKPRDKGL